MASVPQEMSKDAQVLRYTLSIFIYLYLYIFIGGGYNML